MKKYLFGIFAIALAVAFSAFNTKKQFLTTLHYVGTQANLTTQMAQPSNWSTSTSGTPYFSCDAGADGVCSIEVDPAAVDGTQLNSSATITVASATSISSIIYNSDEVLDGDQVLGDFPE